MKARDVKGWKDFKTYLNQIGAKYETFGNFEDNIGPWMVRVHDKNDSRKHIDVTCKSDGYFEGRIVWLTGSMKDSVTWRVKSMVLKNMEMICLRCWSFSRMRKRTKERNERIKQKVKEISERWRLEREV